MGELLNLLMPTRLLQPVLKPVTRLILGLIAVPIFRLFMHRVVRVKEIDRELEKDLELWFRGALLLLLATKNMETFVFSWVTGPPTEITAEALTAAAETARQPHWLFMAGRILLAMGVIEGMPDQALFSVIHPGPPKPQFEKGRFFRSLAAYMPRLIKGLVCQHLNRSSPMFVILAVIFGETPGWIFYGIAITQYLIIGLVTSRDRALDVLQKFDAAIARQRQELKVELAESESDPPCEFDQRVGDAVPSPVIAAAQELQEALQPEKTGGSAGPAN